jgi:GntR family transcriptional regulator
MDMSKLIRLPSLTDQVFQILRDRIYNGAYPPGSKLPNENELIKEFSISKVTLRNAYAKLEEHSLIQRHQGTGTYVTDRLNITDPRYLLMDFDDWISRQGYKPGFTQLDARIVTTDILVAAKLNIDPDSRSLRLEKIRTADGLPVFHSICYLPSWVFEDYYSEDEIIRSGLTEPFFQFLMQKCNVRVDYLISSINPGIINDCDLPAEFSSIIADTPLLLIEDVGCTADGRPIFHSIEHRFGIASKIEALRRVMY